MLRCLSHRGPDDEGVFVGSGATVGARRLSVIDVTGGHQPMYNEEGTVAAVQNGELYNFLDLRSALEARGHRFRSHSDTEILPHGYDEYGTAFLSQVRGMFAIALWDERQRRLVLARDRLGKKPLFYVHRGDTLIFASEIQALLALPDVQRDVDDRAIAEYLTYGYVPAPMTAFAQIRKLEPGHILIFQDSLLRVERYWTPTFTPKLDISLDEAAERLRVLIDDAVRVRLIADVPLGVLLSGGLDSSTVVAFMARHVDRPVRTFSIGFPDAGFDELRYARVVANRFGTDHREFVVEPSAIEILPTLVRHFGEPFADSSAIPTYFVSKIAREHVTVVLNGDGGDELFAGYDRYRAVRLASLLGSVPGASVFFGSLATALPRPLLRSRRVHRTRRMLEALAVDRDERYFRWIGYFVGSRGDAIYGPRTERGRPRDASYLSSAADAVHAVDPVERAMGADLLTALPGDLLAKMDIATMANSLEARSPLLDHKLIEFVSRLPVSYKVSLRTSKIILRHAMRDLLPAEILDRGKMGFSVPVGSWLRGPLRGLLTDVLLAPSALSREYIRPAAVEAIVREHLDARVDRTAHLWALLMLELWFTQCVRGSRSIADPPAPLAARS